MLREGGPGRAKPSLKPSEMRIIMRILDIAAKDIQQILRDWKSALFLLV